jgi:membrane associated rhomboid family serine protease
MSYGSQRFAFGYTLTPWVKRLLVATTALHLLAVLTSHGFFVNWFGFAPREFLVKPWGAVTYMFVHGDVWHLLMNMLILFFFGPHLESRWGGDRFLRFLLLCGVGGAVFSFIFALNTPPVVGASAAMYGLMLAFAWYWPNAPIYFWGIFPILAKYLVGFFFVLAFVSAFGGAGGGVAHFAHVGGLVFGLAYLWGEGRLGARLGPLRKAARGVERLAIVPREERESQEREEISRKRKRNDSTPRSVRREEDLLDEVDRILDKISSQGMGALTDEERRVLDEVSRRRRSN